MQDKSFIEVAGMLLLAAGFGYIVYVLTTGLLFYVIGGAANVGALVGGAFAVWLIYKTVNGE